MACILSINTTSANTVLPTAVLGAGYREGAEMHWALGLKNLVRLRTPRVFDLNVSNFIVFFKMLQITLVEISLICCEVIKSLDSS